MSERRLAAILIADAVAFTARMAENETAALRAIVASLEVLRTIVALNSGGSRRGGWRWALAEASGEVHQRLDQRSRHLLWSCKR